MTNRRGDKQTRRAGALLAGTALAALTGASGWAQDPPNPQRNAYFGDLHVHSGNSFDAASSGITVEPEQAYRFARGEEVEYQGRMVRRNAPLDFLAVTDHSEYMGVLREARDPAGPFADTDWPRILASNDPEDRAKARQIMQSGFYDVPPVEELNTHDTKRRNWLRVIELADRYNDPGTFTTFAAYEWSPTPNGGHHHRNVIFLGPGYPDVPFSSIDSPRPQDLWAFADAQRAAGNDVVLIPHNPNLSGGITFSYTDVDGNEIDRDYAEMRARNERIVEVTQVKGTSETHPTLSPADPFADFEIMDHWWPNEREWAEPGGSYARDAYARGLEIAARTGVNPLMFGMIGSSDFHNAMSATEEDNFPGALGGGDSQADPAALFARFNTLWNMPTIRIGASGVAGVWAEENTRESIFNALKRCEVFATSGPRIQARLFAGWSFEDGLIDEPDWLETAYDEGVPMGGDIVGAAGSGPLEFLVEAMKDPNGANLDRIQIVKVWYEDGESREKVFDVAWAGDRVPARDGLVPPIGSTVDLATATYANDIGAARLSGQWADPEFDPSEPAVYYARVIEIPTPRWTTYLAVRSGVDLPDAVPATLQERAWTSPVFYTPG
jgi:hypothetical protein